MSTYNLKEFRGDYSTTSGSLWQYCKDEPAVNNDVIIDFTNDIDSASLKFKQKITVQTGDNGTEYLEINVTLKYLCNFRRTLEMPLIYCEINLFLS